MKKENFNKEAEDIRTAQIRINKLVKKSKKVKNKNPEVQIGIQTYYSTGYCYLTNKQKNNNDNKFLS